MDLSSNNTKKPRPRQQRPRKVQTESHGGPMPIVMERDRTAEFEDGYENPPDLAFKKPTLSLYQGVRKTQQTQRQSLVKQPTELPPSINAPQGSQGSETKNSKGVADNAVTFVDKLVDEGIDRLKKEYEEINKINPSSEDITAFLKPENAYKNRNINVPCLDVTRVELKNSQSDYIHANFVSTPTNPKKFICTQCPTIETSNDFWLMVAQNDVEKIGMISDMSKGNKEDLALYFPNKTGRSYRFGEVKVTCKKREKMSINNDLRRTTLKVQYLNKSLFVLHYHWASFPCKSVPPIDSTPFQLLGFLRSSRSPVIIHDTFGTGRAGAICLVEIFMETLMIGKEIDTVQLMAENLRKSRAFAIDNEIIYYYVHTLVIEYLKKKLNFQSSQLFLEFIDAYDAVVRKYEKNLAKQEGKSVG
uniref:Tyrosine-protein phosphatase domain-containing protein n=1 Tax=Parastrongyloides trichosuri TaxID=131310 RepID=A0A0N4Z4H9_PARTI